MGELEQNMAAMIGIVGRLLAREQRRVKSEIAAISSAMEKFPGHDASREEIEAWRAANPWPWFEELRAYTLANSEPDVREYQMQWEPEALLAQRTEHEVSTLRVAGSNPAERTIFISGEQRKET